MPTIDSEETGKNIKRLMDEKDISYKDVYLALGLCGHQAVYKWIWGQSLPTLDNLVGLAYLLDCSIDDILVVRG